MYFDLQYFQLFWAGCEVFFKPSISRNSLCASRPVAHSFLKCGFFFNLSKALFFTTIFLLLSRGDAGCLLATPPFLQIQALFIKSRTDIGQNEIRGTMWVPSLIYQPRAISKDSNSYFHFPLSNSKTNNNTS